MNGYPLLPLENWKPTRDTLHAYAKVLGTLREAHTPEQPHWQHVSLRISARGFTTTPMEIITRNGREIVELTLSPVSHVLYIDWSDGRQAEAAMPGQSVTSLCEALQHQLQLSDASIFTDNRELEDDTFMHYNPDDASGFWTAITRLDLMLKKFRSGLQGEKGDVQLWPHHFDLSFNWYSGRRFPAGAGNSEAAEQIGYGFVSGDESIPEPYFYVTRLPEKPGFSDQPVTAPAYYYNKDWEGIVLPYHDAISEKNPEELIIGMFRSVHKHTIQLQKKY